MHLGFDEISQIFIFIYIFELWVFLAIQAQRKKRFIHKNLIGMCEFGMYAFFLSRH